MVGKPAEEIKEAVWDELKNYFRPEFLNRIDETVVFHALDAKNIESIAAIQLKVLEARLAKMDLGLEVSPAALAELAKVGFDPVFGARPLKRAIQQRIENPVATLILEGRFAPKDVMPVGLRGRRVHVWEDGGLSGWLICRYKENGLEDTLGPFFASGCLSGVARGALRGKEGAHVAARVADDVDVQDVSPDLVEDPVHARDDRRYCGRPRSASSSGMAPPSGKAWTVRTESLMPCKVSCQLALPKRRTM